MLSIGSKAPDFKLKLEGRKHFHLRSFHGKANVVISFFPTGLSMHEIDETHGFLQYLESVQSLGVIVVIITSKNVSELKKSLHKYKIKIPVAYDTTLEVCRNYHAFWLRGLGLRKVTYVVDKKGIVRGHLHHHLLTEKTWNKILHLVQDLEVEKSA